MRKLKKVCRSCNVSKPEEGYSKGRTICRTCKTKHSREWVVRNLEKVAAYQKSYGAKNKEKLQAYRDDPENKARAKAIRTVDPKRINAKKKRNP